jgi:galactoside O-acetyltransferase
MGVLNQSAIDAIGFASVGHNVRISDKASFHGADRITVGSNVRSDDFCVLSAGLGGIVIAEYVHLAVYTALIGAGRITVSDVQSDEGRLLGIVDGLGS